MADILVVVHTAQADVAVVSLDCYAINLYRLGHSWIRARIVVALVCEAITTRRLMFLRNIQTHCLSRCQMTMHYLGRVFGYVVAPVFCK